MNRGRMAYGVRPWRLAVLVTTGVVMAVSGCGHGPGVGAASGPTPGSGSAEASSVTARPTVGAPASSPGPGPMGGSGSPVPVVAGEVSVTLNAGRYQVGEVIRVTVANGRDRPVYTEDFKTACSIVVLQRRDAGGWTDILGCSLGRPTMTVTIGPRLGRHVDLDPASVDLAQGRAGGPAFGAGSYRVMFSYSVDPTPGGADMTVVYSPQFAIA